MRLNIDEKILASIKKILSTFVPEYEVRAFGSRVEGKAKKYSDLDLVIVGKEKIENTELRHLREAFEESKIPFRVEILDWHRVSDSFKKVIEKRYEVLQHPRSSAP